MSRTGGGSRAFVVTQVVLLALFLAFAAVGVVTVVVPQLSESKAPRAEQGSKPGDQAAAKPRAGAGAGN